MISTVDRILLELWKYITSFLGSHQPQQWQLPRVLEPSAARRHFYGLIQNADRDRHKRSRRAQR